jgi:hypothetical protein
LSIGSSSKREPASTLLFYLDCDTYHIIDLVDLMEDNKRRNNDDSIDITNYYNNDPNAISDGPYHLRYQCTTIIDESQQLNADDMSVTGDIGTNGAASARPVITISQEIMSRIKQSIKDGIPCPLNHQRRS